MSSVLPCSSAFICGQMCFSAAARWDGPPGTSGQAFILQSVSSPVRYKYILSLPERAVRSLGALSGGLLREIGNVALPPQTFFSAPCSKSGNICLSATLAAEVTTVCTTVSLLSTPMCALARSEEHTSELQ